MHPDLPSDLCRVLESMVQPLALAVCDDERDKPHSAELSIYGVKWRVTVQREIA